MNQRVPILVIGLLIIGAMLATYSNHFHNAFHFDDAHTIEDNGYIRDLKNIKLFFEDCTTSSSMPSHQGYRPLVTTTLAIDYALSMKSSGGKDGYNTLWYHISNFSWFVLIVILLYFIQVKIYNLAFNEPYNKYFALLGCAWYGLHTANAETVNYIISRSDILSTLGIVGSFAIYLGFEKYRKYYLYLIPAAIGMFAKETTIMFAPALIAYDYMIEKQKSLGSLFTKDGIMDFIKSIGKGGLALIVCMLLGLLTIKMTKHHEPGGDNVWVYAGSQPYVILHYITEFFFPVGLTADTDLPEVISISDDRIYFGLAFLIGLIALAFKTSQKKEWRPFAFGIVWFLLMLLPTSSFIALAEVTNDHRVFLPYIGLVISLVCFIANMFYYTLKSRETLKYAMLALLLPVLCGYAYGTHQRNNVWKTDELLWKDVSEKSPHNGRGWMNYGLTLMDRGDYADAQYAYDQALLYVPRYYILYINLGVLNEAEGKKPEAEQYYKDALDYGPNYVESYYYYARYLYNNGRVPEAEIYCNKGLDLFAGHIYSRYLLMDIYNYNHDWTKLAQAAQATLNMYAGDSKATMYLKIAANPSAAGSVTVSAPTAATYLNESLAYYRANNYRACIDACYKALELQPNYAEAYNNMCTAYNQLKQYDSAVVACNKAVELKPDFTLAKNNLNWAKSQLKK